jgi:predicted nucleic acid-binding protein
VRAVSDAGPIIHLSWIGQLELLEGLFEEVLVPEAVRDEVLPAVDLHQH